MIGMLVAGGEIKNYDNFLEYYNIADITIAVDSGAKFFLETEKKPDILIGDLDSIDMDSLNYIVKNNIETIKYPIEKDLTDLEIAINYLIDNNCTEIYAIGTLGSRFDHSLANITLLKKIYDKKIKCYLINDKNRIQYTENNVFIRTKYNNISIVPISLDGIIITLENFYYPLENYFLEYGSTRCISNYLIKETGNINIYRGSALIIESND